MKTSKPWIYISSPFAKGDQRSNYLFHFALFREFQKLYEGEAVFIAPLLAGTHRFLNQGDLEAFFALRKIFDYDYLKVDLDILDRCDAVFLSDSPTASAAESHGCSSEVEKAVQQLHIPVFVDKRALSLWIEGYKRRMH